MCKILNVGIIWRCEEDSKKYLECQNELVQQRRKNALLEKQAGKNKIENGPTSKGVSGKKNCNSRYSLTSLNNHSVNSLKYFLQYYIYLLSNRLFFSAAVGKKRVLGGRAGSMTNVSASFSAGLTEENDHEDYEEIKTK